MRSYTRSIWSTRARERETFIYKRMDAYNKMYAIYKTKRFRKSRDYYNSLTLAREHVPLYNESIKVHRFG